MGISFYGLGGETDAMLIPDQFEGTKLVKYESTQFDIPLFEYRPFRTFSMDQSSSLVFQFNLGIDVPHSTELVSPLGGTVPKLKTVYYLGLRVAFDWRYYF